VEAHGALELLLSGRGCADGALFKIWMKNVREIHVIQKFMNIQNSRSALRRQAERIFFLNYKPIHSINYYVNENVSSRALD